MLESMEGRVVLVTGAARGMGKAIAQMFSKRGARLGLLDALEEELRCVVAEIQEEGGEVLGKVVDVRQSDQVETAVKKIANQFGPIDPCELCGPGDARKN